MNFQDVTVPVVNTFDELVNKLRTVFDSDTVDVDYVQKLLLSYKSNPNEWQKFAHFDRHKYTKNLVDKGNGKYNLMVVCWWEGEVSSPIHNHADSHCFMKILSGNLHEVRFEWPDEDTTGEGKDRNTTNEMKVLEENQLKTNDVAYINGLHLMENRSDTNRAVSLHLYIPPYSECHTFDPRTGRRNYCNVNKFFSKYGTPFKSEKFIDISDKSMVD